MVDQTREFPENNRKGECGMKAVFRWILLTSCAVAFFNAPTKAYHVSYDYPAHNFYWISHAFNPPHSAEVWTESTDCAQQSPETDAATNIRDSTANSAEMPDMPSGYNIWRYSCDGTIGTYDDILYQYEDSATWSAHGHSNVGGVTYHYQAPSSWCTTVGASYPCGDHPVRIHINKSKWDSRTHTWRVHLLMHETGHATGLNEHCTSDAIMNNGVSTCNNGNWSGEYYRATDRTGVYNAYH